MELRQHFRATNEDILIHHEAVDRGCQQLGIGGVLMWRLIKALAQFAVIAATFVMYTDAAISGQVALLAMVTVYLGAEGLETLIASIGRNQIKELLGAESIEITVQSSEDSEQEDLRKYDD